MSERQQPMPSAAASPPETAVPLCVDLDGTLIRTDLLWESLVQLLKHNPLCSFLVPFWLLKGRSYLKAQIAARTSLDVASLPFNDSFLEFLREQHRAGRSLFLVTASDRGPARRVADHLGVFSEVLASDGVMNLRGHHKGETLAKRFGQRGFDYAGNSTVDLPVWQQAREAIVVNAGSSLARKAGRLATVRHEFPVANSISAALLQALRPHQWVKNLIVFVPLITSHQIGHANMLGASLLAFIAFCLCASGVYVLNDLFDLEADRHHPTKRFRPFASGRLPLYAGFALIPLLFAAGAAIAAIVSLSFLGVLALYLVLTTSYSWWLKQVALLDVFLLAGLYTSRLVAGHTATSIPYSVWLLAFSMFIFLSLALVKRFVEVHSLRSQSRSDVKGRGYMAGDFEVVTILGITTGCLSALVLALYVSSDEVRLLYQHPTLLLLICPLLLYWISRVWLLGHREQLHDDPVVFALKDPVSYAVGILALAVIWLASGR